MPKVSYEEASARVEARISHVNDYIDKIHLKQRHFSNLGWELYQLERDLNALQPALVAATEAMDQSLQNFTENARAQKREGRMPQVGGAQQKLMIKLAQMKLREDKLRYSPEHWEQHLPAALSRSEHAQIEKPFQDYLTVRESLAGRDFKSAEDFNAAVTKALQQTSSQKNGNTQPGKTNPSYAEMVNQHRAMVNQERRALQAAEVASLRTPKGGG